MSVFLHLQSIQCEDDLTLLELEPVKNEIHAGLQSRCSAGDSMQYGRGAAALNSVCSGLLLWGLEVEGCRDERVHRAHF